MSFLAICHSKPNSDALRRRTRTHHLEYMIAHHHLLRYGGAMVNEDATAVTAMVIVLDVPTRELAKEFVEREPYNAAGLFERVVIERWVQRIPEPEPGFLQAELERERRESSSSIDRPSPQRECEQA